MRQNGARCFASDHGAYDITDGQRFGALLFGFPLSGKRIRSFTRLADADHQSVIVHDGIAVAEFAAVIHLHGNSGQPLDHELTGQAGMPTGAAGYNLYVAEITEVLFADLHLVEEDLAGFLGDTAQHGVSDGPRLLENFL